MDAVKAISRAWTAAASSGEPSIAVTTGIASGNPYHGSYEVTATDEVQVLPTALCVLAGDIVVNPIPSNYGLVEWDGSVLTVS